MCNCIYLRQSDATPDPINFLLCSAQPCRHPLNYFLLQSILVRNWCNEITSYHFRKPCQPPFGQLLSWAKKSLIGLNSTGLHAPSMGTVLWFKELQLKLIHGSINFLTQILGFTITRPDQTTSFGGSIYADFVMFRIRLQYLNRKLEMSWALNWHHKI